MFDESFLPNLRCPVTSRPLLVADEESVQRLNERIQEGVVRFRCGEVVKEPVDGALVDESHEWIHVIRREIATLIADEAIPWESVGEKHTI